MIRKTPIAWCQLVHDWVRTGLSLAGIGFALVVIFMQLGFRQAVERTATIVLGELDFDILIRSKSYLYLASPGSFPMARIHTAKSVPGVRSVVPFYVQAGLWQSLSDKETPAEEWGWAFARRHPAPREGWKPRLILVLAYDLNHSPFVHGVPGLRERGPGWRLAELDRPGTLLIDQRSRPEFGPKDPDTPVELNQHKFEIVGEFAMGTGFAADGAVLMNHHNFAQAFGGDALGSPTLGLIKVDDTRKTADILNQLRQTLPVSDQADGALTDVEVLRRDDVIDQEIRVWLNEKAIGIIFTMGVWIAFLVGFIVFYQVFSSDIADHLPEYAMLKAIGYSDRQIGDIVVHQAVLLGLIGYAGALVVAWGLYTVIEAITRLPMTLWNERVLGVPLALGLVISCGSALISIRKVRLKNPSDLFR
jgi:putative ABC transport system permease protein